MKVWFLALALVGAFISPLSAAGPSFDDLWKEATHGSDSVVTEFPDFTKVTSTGGHTFYYFTKPGHPAHPAVIKREAVKQKNGVWIVQRNGYSDAAPPQAALKAWLVEFDGMDRQMLGYLNQNVGEAK